MALQNPYVIAEQSQAFNSGLPTNTEPTSGEEETDSESRGQGHRHYTSEQDSWSEPDSDVDPIYIREDKQSDLEPLPRIESEYHPKVDLPIEEHFIGIKTSKEAEEHVKADDFALYYRNERSNDVDSAIRLYLVHRNTKNEVYHFPVVRCEDNGLKWWFVQIGNNRMQSFRLLSDLVRCYHLYRFTDARSGRMEVFPLWQGGIVDQY
ncbi:hypothetical protein V3C99_005732, partial [Haemonchus contortus]